MSYTASTMGHNFNVPTGAGVAASMAFEIGSNLQPDRKELPPKKRRRQINQILYEWNIRLDHPNIDIIDATYSIEEYGPEEARWETLLNSAEETLAGGILSTGDALLSNYTGGLPIMKASFQPRLPKYEPGDIALTLGFTYTYHEGTRPVTDVVHRKYYKHWTHKLFKNSPPEGGPDWFYVNQLELLIRGNNIWEAEYIRTYYIKNEILNDFGRYQTRYSTHN